MAKNATALSADQIGTIVGDALNAAERAHQLAATLQDRRMGLDAERKSLRQRNDHIRRLPLRRDDAKEALTMSIDHLARGFKGRVRWKDLFSRFAWPQRSYAPSNTMTDPSRRARPMCLADIEDAAKFGSGSVFNLGAATLVTGELDGRVPMVDALCFFFGDAIKRKIEEEFDEMFPDYSQHSPRGRGFEEDWAWLSTTEAERASPVGERRVEIARNDERIAALDAQIDEIDCNLSRLRAVTPSSADE